MITADTTLLHLSLINGVGAGTINHIVDALPTDFHWSSLYQWKQIDWLTIGISVKQADRLVRGLADNTLIAQEISLIERHQIQWMSILDPEYPALLKQIRYPPIILYWYGKHPRHLGNSLAVIGSRQADHYAQRVINTMVPELVAHGLTITSGGALGADGMAHAATLQAKGNTIAVLGSGLLKWYPSQHRSLFEQIVKNGTLLSIFPVNTAAQAGNFPTRNRVIAGLSIGCLVIQAAEQSGARITAQFALDEGREVFAIPGLIDDPLSAGCHALIQQGAKLVGNCADIITELSMIGLPATTIHSQKNGLSKAHTISVQSLTATHASVDSLSNQLLVACRMPKTIDELIDICNQNRTIVQAALIDLSLAGTIQQDFTGAWVAV